MGSNGSSKAKNKSSKKSSSTGRKIVILAIEVILLVLMICALWVVIKVTDEDEGVKHVEISTDDIIINEGVKNPDKEEVTDETKVEVEDVKVEKYRTIALFGLDSTIGELIKNTRSDTIMIASLNDETKEVRIMSVYRDTYLNLSNDTYNKCNSAYAKGGAKQAINMLNMNLDLAITDFVAVGFKGVKDAVDAVGGIYIDISAAELEHINNYQISIAENLKTTYTPITTTGYQKVDGLQATAYCRIRHSDNDFKRTERQREVLTAVLEEAKKLEIATLTKIVKNVVGDFYTSIDIEEIVDLVSDLSSYTLVDAGGFPMNEYLVTGSLGQGVGDSVVCTDLEAAVSELHKIFFDEEDYEPSETVKEISDVIYKNTSKYIKY
jgi:LCP family protein required for cell wall assembly